MKIGFDNDKYLSMQSEHIRQRINQFDNKLYLEFGGKLFDDYHASRVLPGFAPDSKLRMLMQLSDHAEIVIVISAGDIEKNKVRGDLGITYDIDVLRLIDAFRGRGFYVGSVVITQYSGQNSANKYKDKLEKLGIRWNHRLEAAWEKGFASAQKYRTEHGDLLVPVRYRDKNDFALGEWIVYNRQRYLGGNLTQNRIERLEAIGMVWSTSNDLWEQNYAAATQYYLEHGDLEVPIKYETPSGFGLGVWLGAQRAAHKAGELPQEQVERLDALGMDWTNRNDRKWMSLYDVAAAYYHEHGNLNVPSEYVTPDGVLLGKWVARQRYAYLNPDRSSARVTPERKALLDKLGMVWEKYDPWQERYDLALAYKTEHGDLEIPSVYKTADGVWLGSWVSRQRQALNSGSSALSSERRKLLRTLFKGERRPSDPTADHGTVREANWERNFRSAARYARKYKHLLVPASYVDSDGVRLGVWISNLRAARKNRPDSYQVTPAHIKKLNSIGMVWDARDAKWGTAYQQAKAYYKAHGNLHAAANYKSDETGFCLGDWLRRMREWDTTHDPKLTPERRAMLDKIGMEWSE